MNPTQIEILLADDDQDDCLLFKEALQELPVSANLTMVNDGDQLMCQLLKNTDKLPDTLFLDLNMPRKNGFQCLDEIKHDPRLKELTVIIFSTSFEQSISDQLYKMGAQHYIRKPCEFSKLKQTIQRALILTSQENGTPPPRGMEYFVLKDDTIAVLR